MLELKIPKQKFSEESTYKSKLYFLIPVFIAALIIGFFIELTFFEKLSFRQLSAKLKDTYLLSQSQYESEESTYYISKHQEGNKIHDNLTKPFIWKDDQTLLDIENFTFLENNKSICNPGDHDGNSLLILLLVSSERNHFNERRAVRETYGSILKFQDFNIRLVFLLGISSEVRIDANPFDVDNDTVNSLLEKQNILSREENELVKNESFLYGDLIVGDFIESQSNLSYKHLMGYKWVLNYCPRAHYVFKLNDNVFINLHKFLSAKNKHSFSTDFLCRFLADFPSDCSFNELGYDIESYPKFCPGWFYGVSVDWIYKIYSVSQKATFLQLDDVFVTGILRDKAEKSFGVKATISNNVTITIRSDKNELCHRDGKPKNNTKTTTNIIYLQREENLAKNFRCLWNNTFEKY